jgi:hypothetical protein
MGTPLLSAPCDSPSLSAPYRGGRGGLPLAGGCTSVHPPRRKTPENPGKTGKNAAKQRDKNAETIYDTSTKKSAGRKDFFGEVSHVLWRLQRRDHQAAPPQRVCTMDVKIQKGHLIVTLPLISRPSSSGKTILVASSGGNVATSATVDNKTVKVGLNAFIPAN